jgi:hypothetical protein
MRLTWGMRKRDEVKDVITEQGDSGKSGIAGERLRVKFQTLELISHQSKAVGKIVGYASLCLGEKSRLEILQINNFISLSVLYIANIFPA